VDGDLGQRLEPFRMRRRAHRRRRRRGSQHHRQSRRGVSPPHGKQLASSALGVAALLVAAAKLKGAVACWPSYIQVAIANSSRLGQGRGERESQRGLHGGVAT